MKMASTTGKLIPPMMWAQRKDKLFLTINLEDVKSPEIKLDEKKLYFSGTKGANSADQVNYEYTVEFFEDIDPAESKYGVLPRHIPMVLMKKSSDGPFWPRLTKEKTRMPQLKTDFDKWKEEDDSDVDDNNDMKIEDMMSQMGNFGGAADMGADIEGVEADDEDSDDEKLPDLES
ncbi:DgyrCDS5608 [Dimorphilus gyrociliatus]|uniref:DgyrCDS5608 n=1 Tax=Dimorphilus gyrociliatus TaxID=2664684 RepID=A0A7I8VLZ7_9ANNE|nr:DgyrCDS5608 [Dimorphilus gyrociliatus]